MLPRSLPTADVPPLRDGPVLRWGVLGPGRIAGDWVTALHTQTDQRVAAVASRDPERGRRFAAQHGIPSTLTAEQLAAAAGIDAVYIAAPHSAHRDLALLAIAGGKHVLVEKPLAVSASQAREIANAARAAGVLAMEAMWSRFLPQHAVIARLLADGELGDVRLVTAELGYRFDPDPASRIFDPALGGGAMLDLGVYPVWFAHAVLGAPHRVTAAGSLAATGVDEQAALILDHDGAQAALAASAVVSMPGHASISGTTARLEFTGPFFGPSSFRLVGGSDALEWQDASGLSWSDGLAYQAAAFAAHVAEGLGDSPLHPLSTSIAVLEVIDQARAQLGAR